MRSLALFAILSAAFITGCSGTRLVDDTKRKVDDSVDRATDKVEALVKEAKVSVNESLEKAKLEYKGALQDTSVEITKLREDLMRDLAELDRKTTERIDQIKKSAAELIQQGNQAVQARIDQLFTELNKFTVETLDRITKLIQPILTMADKIGTAVENGDKHLTQIVEKISPVFDSVISTLSEARKGLLELRGRNPETGEKSENPWWTRGIVLALTGAFAAWRKNDQKKNGDRWKREELKENARLDISDLLKSGEYDDEIAGRIRDGIFDDVLRARLMNLGVLSVRTTLTREGGDPPPVVGGPTSPKT